MRELIFCLIHYIQPTENTPFTKILSPPKTHVIHWVLLVYISLSMQKYAATHGYILIVN